MTTSLSLTAPDDLSVGRVSLESGSQLIHDWIATPGNTRIDLPELAPGLYTARVEPLGQPSRSFLFDVRPGEANTVVVPPISVMASGPQLLDNALADALTKASAETGSQSFSLFPNPSASTDTGRSATFSIFTPGSPDSAPAEAGFGGLGASFPAVSAPPSPESGVSFIPEGSYPVSAAPQSRAFCLGLSQDDDPRHIGGWRPYSGAYPLTQQIVNGGLEIVIARGADPLSLPGDGARLRISFSLEKSRVERFMVPLFVGGVRIAVQPTTVGPADLTLLVHPVDNARRAMTQALRAGSSAEAEAVFGSVLTAGTFERFIEVDDDPWAGIVAALLTVRFPDCQSIACDRWTDMLLTRYPWIPDVHLLSARRLLLQAGTDPKQRRAMTHAALDAFAASRTIGAPYFAYANQLARDLLSGLSDAWRDDEMGARVSAEWRLWLANAPLQREAGASFSWLMAEPRDAVPRTAQQKLKTETSQVTPRGDANPVPYTRTHGQLDTRYTRIIFFGRLQNCQVTVVPTNVGQSGRENHPADPAERVTEGLDVTDPQPVDTTSDPNKGRFGGQAEANGYRLSAAFSVPATSRAKTVGLTLSVTAVGDIVPDAGSKVVFFLHPTFPSPTMTAVFRGSTASLKLWTQGGFTVGARVPGRDPQAELELDLAELPEAPWVVRTL